ncbi:lipopolysaccharide assembly protein LapA domain-containing protein [Larsenimonas rhizosphaerae]|uniref:Lipopolysaccharide assembly protein LapA domain-containing protein n=1 Tax=Larsenimonas rhizosphaerae TaxID=2944682 RepID=A0AA41ZF04_9GAMM|nr:lipopolysaccharide assembly protein LapA domain-containing protein [Larsenimonas rhizosphaerae]MCM2130898.1 lipopolysaccharide assembly protein LapA domain-containing protein [Larsenimonas rhizosphaerae]MCX2523602.1 lipopolysaccharide assembly protein LapA domain-containing protein [Larsenimonas rhizosphaerae]
MRWIKGVIMAIVALVVIVLGILFAVRNQASVPLDIIWTSLPPASLSLWLLSTLVVGVLLGMIAMTGMYLRLRTALVKARHEQRTQQKELDQLRTRELKGVS